MDLPDLQWHPFLPLLAGFLYALAALGFKAATAGGASVFLVTILANAVTAFVFLVFVPWSTLEVSRSLVVASVVPGVLFILGQVSVVLALRKGDVSVATPLMNTKVVCVAVLLFLFYDEPLTAAVIAAIVLTFLGVFLLQGGGGAGRRGAMVPTIVFSLMAAFSFAVFDVVVQAQSKVYGFGAFVPFGMVWAAVLSLLALPWIGRFPRGKSGRIGLAMGAVLMAAQAAAFVATIGHFGEATNANIVYASRALWSMAVVWLFGKWLGNRELEIEKREIVRRAVGASLLVAGVALVLAG